MQIQISWLLQKPTDLGLHCLQMQSISRFSRTKDNMIDTTQTLTFKRMFFRYSKFCVSFSLSTFLSSLLISSFNILACSVNLITVASLSFIICQKTKSHTITQITRYVYHGSMLEGVPTYFFFHFFFISPFKTYVMVLISSTSERNF